MYDDGYKYIVNVDVCQLNAFTNTLGLEPPDCSIHLW
jgi:hypothetical protein